MILIYILELKHFIGNRNILLPLKNARDTVSEYFVFKFRRVVCSGQISKWVRIVFSRKFKNLNTITKHKEE